MDGLFKQHTNLSTIILCHAYFDEGVIMPLLEYIQHNLRLANGTNNTMTDVAKGSL